MEYSITAMNKTNKARGTAHLEQGCAEGDFLCVSSVIEPYSTESLVKFGSCRPPRDCDKSNTRF